MTELVETIAKALVDEPDHVRVTSGKDRHGDVIQLQVAGNDMGKVIGKKGRIAKALRTVVKAAATKQKKSVSVEIVSEDEIDPLPGTRRKEHAEAAAEQPAEDAGAEAGVSEEPAPEEDAEQTEE